MTPSEIFGMQFMEPTHQLLNLLIIRDFLRDQIEDRPLNREWIIWLLAQSIDAQNSQVNLNPEWLKASKHLTGVGFDFITRGGKIEDKEPPIYWSDAAAKAQ